MRATNYQPEWPTDELGNVGIRHQGRLCKYVIVATVFVHSAAYSVLRLAEAESDQSERQILICKYIIKDHGHAWVRPVYGQYFIIAASHYLLGQGWKSGTANREVN